MIVDYGDFLKEYKLFVQRIGLVGITNILISLSSLILLPILTKNLTIQDYGVWAQFIATVTFIPLVVNLGLPYSMVRFLPVKTDKNQIKEEFYSITFLVLFVSLIASLLLYIFSKQIGAVFFNGNTIVAQLLAIIGLFMTTIASFLNYFRTFQQMKLYSIITLIQTYFMVILVSFLVISGYGVEIAVSGYFIVQLVIFLIVFALVISQIGFKFPEFKNIREYLSFGLPTVPGNLSSWMVELSDRYVIGIILGITFVGYYTPAYTLGNIIAMFLSPFAFILPPLLSSCYDQNKMEEVENYMRYSLKYFVLIALPSVFGLSLLSRPLLEIITTSAIAINSYFITPFIALGAFLFGIYGIVSQALVLEKKTKIIGSMWIFAAFINIALNILLVPILGITAAAITTLIAYVITLVVTVFYSQKYIRLKFDYLFALKSLIASILMSLIIVFINPVTITGILITVLICAGVYLLSLFLLKGISREEIEFFKKLVVR